jgi:hypothetical protein
VHLLLEHFEEVPHDTVVDVEFILGERSTPKVSERVLEGCPPCRGTPSSDRSDDEGLRWDIW